MLKNICYNNNMKRYVFFFLLIILCFICINCVSNKIDISNIPQDTLVITRGKDVGIMPEINSGRLGFKSFGLNTTLYYNKPRFDIYRQSRTVAQNSGGSVNSSRRTVWTEEKEDYEVIAINLENGFYVDVAGNVFINPIEVFNLDGITKIVDKADLLDKKDYYFEDNKLYISSKKNQKDFLLAEQLEENINIDSKTQEDALIDVKDLYISHANGIFGKKKSVLRYDNSQNDYVFEKEKGMSIDIPVRFKLQDNTLSLTRKIFKFTSELKVIRRSGRIDVTEKDKVVASVLLYENAIIVEESENSGRILYRDGNLLKVIKYGYR